LRQESCCSKGMSDPDGAAPGDENNDTTVVSGERFRPEKHAPLEPVPRTRASFANPRLSDAGATEAAAPETAATEAPGTTTDAPEIGDAAAAPAGETAPGEEAAGEAPAPAEPPAPVEEWFFIGQDGNQQGPFGLPQMQGWFFAKQLPVELQVRKGVEGDFSPAMMFPSLMSPPPLEPKLKERIEAFVKKLEANPKMESMAREKMAASNGLPNFTFLFGGEGALHYEELKKKAGIVVEAAPAALPVEPPKKAAPSGAWIEMGDGTQRFVGGTASEYKDMVTPPAWRWWPHQQLR
jgi:hypothetical protein